MGKRGQSSIEFTVLISFMFFVFVVFFYVVGSRFAQIRTDNDRLMLEDYGDYLKSEVSLAAGAADGYSRVFFVPDSLNNRKYRVDINEYTGTNLNFSEMVVSYVNYSLDYSYVMRLPINIHGDIDQYAGSYVVISKRGNLISLNTSTKCTNGQTVPCGTDTGECISGLKTCTSGVWGSCVGAVGPVSEICDNKDNDCNGLVDDMGTSTCGVGACQRTIQSCIGGVTQSCVPGTPGTEVCNNIDDDCNGSVDDGLGTSTCGVGACQRTTQNCVGGVTQSCVPGTPGTEICGDGIDNDCDGSIDEGCCSDECGPNGNRSCDSGSSYHICGNYDADSCLEWNTSVSCNTGEICGSGGNCLLWWNSSWPYREMMYLEDTSPINASGISVKLALDTASFISSALMDSQCNDIRFTGSNANFLQHLIETGCNSPRTIIWLKMNITSNTNNTIYMYYGNPSAPNPDAVTAANLTLELSNDQNSGSWTRSNFFITNLSDATQSGGAFVGNCSENSPGNNTFTLCSKDVLPFLSSGNISSKYIYWNFSSGGDTSHLKNMKYELTVNGNRMVFWDMYGNTSENITNTNGPAGQVARSGASNAKQINLSSFKVGIFGYSDSGSFNEHYFNETSVMNSTGQRYYSYNYPLLRFIRNETR